MKKLQMTDSRIQIALEKYLGGLTLTEVSKDLKIDRNSLAKLFKEHGLLKDFSKVIRQGKNKACINDDALDELTPEALYWIGFLYADGHIEKDRPRVTVTLQKQDESHLLKFSEFFGCSIRTVKGSGKYKNETYLRCAFSSKKVYEKLKFLGFTNNKSLLLKPHYLLLGSKDFWRGVIDGDGSLYYSNDKRANGKYSIFKMDLYGTEDTLNSFLIFLEANGIKNNVVPRKRKNANVYQISISDITYKAVNLLYKDATVYLERKYNTYLEMTQENK
jgi:hypothetical protein